MSQFIVFIIVSFHVTLYGAVWTGGGSNDDWSDSGNWDTSPSSGSSTLLYFDNDGVGSANHDLNGFTLNGLSFGNALTAAFDITANNANDVLTFAGTSPSLTMDSDFSANIESDITLSSDTLFSGSGSGLLTLSGDITGSSALELGSGDYAFTSTSNAFTGGFTLSGGSLSIDRSTLGNSQGDITIPTSGSSVLGNGTITISGGNLLLDADDDMILARAMTFNGGTSLLNTDDDLTIDGLISVSAGTHTFSTDKASGNQILGTGNWNVTGGTVVTDAGKTTIGGTVNVDGGDFELTSSSNFILFGDSVTLDSGSITANATADVTFNGDLTVNGGTLDVFDGQASGDDMILNGTSTFNGGTSTFDGADFAATGSVIVDGGTLNITSDAKIAIDQNLSVLSGAATLYAETDINLSATSLIQVDSGTLDISNNGASGSNLIMLDGSSIDLNGGSTTISAYNITLENLTIDNANFDVTSANTLIFDGPTTVNASSETIDFTAGGAININENFTATAGTLNFVSSDNDIKLNAGVTFRQDAGAVTVNTGDALSHDFIMDATATLDLNGGTFTVSDSDDAALNGTMDINGGALSVTSRTQTNFNGAFSMTTGDLTVDASSVLAINNTFQIDAGTAILDSADDINLKASTVFTMNGGSFTATAGSGTDHDFILNTSAIFDLNGGSVIIDADNANFAGVGTIDSGSLSATALTDIIVNKLWEIGASSGSGSLTYDAGGFIDINGGITMAGTSLDFDAVGNIQLDSNFTQSSGTTTMDSGDLIRINGGSLLQIDGGSFTANATNDFDINGTSSLDLNAGNLTITADNINLGGTTTIDGGSLDLNATTNIDISGPFNASAGTIDFAAAKTIINDTVVIAPSASLTISAGTVLFDSTSDFDGTVTVHGDIEVDSPTMTNTPDFIIANGVSNQIRGEAGTESLTGLGILSINNGTTTLDATIASLDAVTIDVNGGTLLLGADAQISGSTNLDLDGGTFSTAGFDAALGSLTLTTSSTINMGSGSSTLSFSDLIGSSLTIEAWDGNQQSGGGTDQIIFGTSLSQGQLDSIYWSGLDKTGARQLPSGEIVPLVPEAQQFYAVGLLFLSAIYMRKRRNNAVQHSHP